eukprot:TRINITY_DN5657_c0_g1_i1.p1 TRINITY_DN5657_c0_g1~~TRINITY_DN5657_c0_g1_i1.p1  ORF type:complete len:920 (+),score=170.63 TRINITY_DN5657_c0_g1_i1:145-2904(+)
MLDLTRRGWFIRISLLFVWPLAVCLPIALATDPSPSGNVAIIFFALLPHWIWPLLYLGERLKLFSIDEAITVPEVFCGAAFSGFVLPVLILVPLLEALSLTAQEHAILLFNIIILPGIWLPLVMAIMQTPIVLDVRLQTTKRNSDTFSDTSYLKHEFRSTFLSWFGLITIPIGMFLPIFIHSDTSKAGEGVIIFFLLAIGVTCALLLVVPRLAWTLQHFYHIFTRPETYHVLVDVVFGMFVLPVMVMLPVLQEVPKNRQPHDVLQAFTIGTPCLALLKAVYDRYRTYEDPNLVYIMLVAVFVVVILPLGVLLPVWVAVPESISAAGQITLLVFMLTPLVAVLCYWHYWQRTNPNLPYHLLTRYLEPKWWVEHVYATVIFALPACIALPVYFHSNLATDADWVLVGYWVVIELLIAALFIVSAATRQPGNPDPWKPLPAVARPRTDTGRSRADTTLSQGNGMFRGPGHERFNASDLGSRRGTRVGHDPTVDMDGLPVSAMADRSQADASLHPRPSITSQVSMTMPGQRVPTGLSVQAWAATPPGVPNDYSDLQGSLDSQPAPAYSRDDDDNKSAITAISIPPPPAGAPPPADIVSLDEYPGFGDEEPQMETHAAVPRPTSTYEAVPQAIQEEEYELVELPERQDNDDSPWEACKYWKYDAAADALVEDNVAAAISITALDADEEPRAGAYNTIYTAYVPGVQDAYVLKWPFYATMQTQEAALIAMRKLNHARSIAQQFNAAVASTGAPPITFNDSRVVQLTSRPDAKGRIAWVVYEPELEDYDAVGVMDYYCIFNDSSGGVVSQDDMEMDGLDPSDNSWKLEFNQANDLAQALSCFSFFASQKRSLMVNIQGVRTTFTNPDFHFVQPDADPYFSPHNNGEEGVRAFFDTYQHNELCAQALKSLPDYDPSWLKNGEYIQVL